MPAVSDPPPPCQALGTGGPLCQATSEQVFCLNMNELIDFYHTVNNVIHVYML